MDLGLIVLRLAHVVAGASWVGGAFLMILIVSRTAKLSGAEGEEFFSRLMTVGRGAKYFELIALTTVVAGALLYLRASSGLQLGWITSPTGIGFTIGASAAIVSLVWGGTMVGPTTQKLQAIGMEIAASGGVATGTQREAVDALRARLELFGKADLLLLGIAVVLAVTDRDGHRRPDRDSRDAASASPSRAPAGPSAAEAAGALADESVPPGSDGVEARLTFAGVVLERRAVGVTATYPTLEVTSDGERSLAHLELPTYNCLADRAPADPVAAGCSRSSTEYADLREPELTVVRDGGDGGDGEVRIAGRFPTYLRPNGTAPAWTGRAYELTVTAAPGSGDAEEGWTPATGELRLGADRTDADAARSRLRVGD